MRIRTLIAGIGFVGFGLSAAVHSSTFLGIDPLTSWPGLSVMHPLAMLAAASVLLSGNNAFTLGARSTFWNALDGAPAGDTDKLISTMTGKAETNARQEAAEAQLVKRLRPSRLKVAAAILASYAVINFVASLALLQGGIPTQHGDEYALTAHGKVIQTLSADQYRWDCAYQTRLATGHWMFLFFISGAFWLVGGRRNPGRRSALTA